MKPLAFIFLLFSLAALGQNKSLHDSTFNYNGGFLANYKHPFQTHPEIGLAWQCNTFAEIGIMRSMTEDLVEMNEPTHLFGYKAAIETNLIPNNYVIAPKIAVEADIFILAFRANLTDFIGQGINDLRFTPEVGITLGGYFSFCIGYNLPLLAHRINLIQNEVLSFNINYNKAYHDYWHRYRN